MRFLIRGFFKTLRVVLGPFMLLSEAIRRPKGIVRAPEAQQKVDAACNDLTLYQFTTCPFCIKVRQEMCRLSLKIERRDAQHDADNRAELQTSGGELKVPCLRIAGAGEGGADLWLYESGKIIDYLRGRFAVA